MAMAVWEEANAVVVVTAFWPVKIHDFHFRLH